MTQMIQIRPTPELRRAFAEWAVGQRPKIRTVSPVEFAVPADLFVDMPESVLIGALVDGHRYASPDEDAALGRPGPGQLLSCGLCQEEGGQEVHPHPECTAKAELLGVATQEGLTPVLIGEAGPETVVPLGVALDPAGPHACDRCDREFTTERGRDLHTRAKHSEASDGS